MNSTTCSTTSGCESVSANETDASCRLPLLVLFGHAAFWLLVSSAFGILASLKFHKPDLLSDCACLSYGRIHAAATTAFTYGFAIQAGLGVGLWIVASLGQSRVSLPLGVIVGGKLWNFGVLLGVLGVLAGSTTGFDYLEMPRYSAVLLFIAVFKKVFEKLPHRQRPRRIPPLQPSV
jgi:cytochrome c oxidase cbb3-type subunit 1